MQCLLMSYSSALRPALWFYFVRAYKPTDTADMPSKETYVGASKVTDVLVFIVSHYVLTLCS